MAYTRWKLSVRLDIAAAELNGRIELACLFNLVLGTLSLSLAGAGADCGRCLCCRGCAAPGSPSDTIWCWESKDGQDLDGEKEAAL